MYAWKIHRAIEIRQQTVSENNKRKSIQIKTETKLK